MVMTDEMKARQTNGKDFMCVCNMCTNYNVCLAQDKEKEKLLQEAYLDEKSAGVFVWVTAILIGVFLGYAWCWGAMKGTVNQQNAQIQQYKIYVDDVKSSKEWQAIDKCKDGDYWKAECIAWELNNGGK